jgi:hypothetical protein
MDDQIAKMNDYHVLLASGHSPAKALEISLDAARGDAFCIGWIKLCREQRAAGKPVEITGDML